MHRAHRAPGHTCNSLCHPQLWGRGKPTVNGRICDPFSPAATKALNYPEPRKGFAFDTSIYLGKTERMVCHMGLQLNRESIPRVKPLGTPTEYRGNAFFFVLCVVLVNSLCAERKHKNAAALLVPQGCV